MQQTFLNILKKYFNVVKALADLFLLFSRLHLAKIYKRRCGLRYQIFCVFFFFFFWVKKTLYFIIIVIGKEY